MTNKARFKFALFVVGIAVTVPVVLIGLSLLTQFVTAFQKGADPASIFRGHTLIHPAHDEAYWFRPVNVSGTMPSEAQREEIIAAYWLAWDALSRAHLTGDRSDLHTYWAGVAYEFAISGIDPQHSLSQTHTGHALRLGYFSDDGSVAAFQDKSFTIVRQLDDQPLTLTATAAVVMTLDQGFWRVRSLTLRYE